MSFMMVHVVIKPKRYNLFYTKHSQVLSFQFVPKRDNKAF